MKSLTPRRFHPEWLTLPLALLALAVFLYAVTFAYLTIVRYQAFEARALDLGNLNQAIWNTAHGNWYRLTNQQPDVTNRLSLHVEPILLLIAPLYRLFPQVETLLLLQAIIVACGALPLFALARHYQLSAWFGLLFGVAFLLNPSIQAANWLEFHPATLAPTFLLAAFYFLVSRRTGWFALFAILAASCKEEIGLLVFMLGLYALVILRQRKVGAFTMVLALAWSLIAVLGIQGYFAGGNIHWGRYGYLGDTITAKLTNLVLRPDLVIFQLQQAGALRYVFELLLPVGFTALLGPEVLLLALPSLAINLLADFAPMHEVTTLIYAAPLVPFVMAGSVVGIQRTIAWAQRRTVSEPDSRPAASRRRRPFNSPARPLSWVLATLVLSGAVVSQQLYGYLPGSGHYLPLQITDHHRRAADIIAQIPADAVVSAQDRLNPHVSGRKTVYIFPRVDDADTVLLDVSGSAWPQHPNDLKANVAELLAHGFGIAAAEDGYLLLSKHATTQNLPPAFYTAWQPPAARPGNLAAPIVFGDQLELLDYAVRTDQHGELVVDLIWQALQPLTTDLRFYIGFLDSELNVLHDSQFYQPTSVLWYPTSMWPPGQPVLVQSLPWTLEASRFALAVGVYSGEDGWNSGNRLAVTSPNVPVPVLDGGTMVRLGGYERTAKSQWQPIPLVSAPPKRATDAQFGDVIRLDGVTLPASGKAGSDLPFVLYWQARKPPAADYNSFVHLLDGSGNKVAQFDGTPHDAISKLPTTAWPVGWPVVDSQAIALPPDLAPGDYSLVTGLYDWRDGARLPTSGADAGPGDVVLLGTVRINQ